MSASLRVVMVGLALLTVGLLAGCTLGPGVPSIDDTPAEVTFAPEVESLDGGEQGTGDTPAPSFATVTPAPQDTITPQLEGGTEAAFGPIAVDDSSDGLRTLETATIRLRRGSAVSNVTCRYIIQETATEAQLDPPTTTQIDATTYEDVFTFSPTQAGTYQVNCTGLATTEDGLRTVGVNAVGSLFSVDAKG